VPGGNGIHSTPFRNEGYWGRPRLLASAGLFAICSSLARAADDQAAADQAKLDEIVRDRRNAPGRACGHVNKGFGRSYGFSARVSPLPKDMTWRSKQTGKKFSTATESSVGRQAIRDRKFARPAPVGCS